MSLRNNRVAALRAEIPEVSPTETLALQREGAVLIDVREAEEVAQGSPQDAAHLVRGYLELRIEEVVPNLQDTIVLMCAVGVRSLFAADGLRQLGYTDVRSMSGGFNAWKNTGLPIEVPRGLSGDARERYARHLLIPGVGEEGQRKLLEATVLLIGAGGLGSPAAYYLAAAGVGTLRILDDDVVDRSNLQRQILHTDDRIGMPKVESARRTLNALNPGITVEALRERLTSDNVDAHLQGCDVVLDGADNFATRYLINDACIKHHLPDVHGSIFRFEGQVSTFWPSYPMRRGPCYRCLFPEPPPPELAPSCAEAGVLGVLPGVIGTLQAVEAVKLILGLGDPLVGRLLVYDALGARFLELEQRARDDCAWCAEGRPFPGYVDYESFCRGPE